MLKRFDSSQLPCYLSRSLNIKILQVTEDPKYLEKPDYNNKYNYYVEDTLDFTIHRDIGIDNIKNKTCNN
jgi:hypothetical protein